MNEQFIINTTLSNVVLHKAAKRMIHTINLRNGESIYIQLKKIKCSLIQQFKFSY